MTAEQREKEEKGDIQEKLVQKLERYLRANFDEKSADVTDGTLERLLLEVGQDWCLNRGVPLDASMVRDSCDEALKRYRKNWKGKKQGEDDRSDALGRIGGPSLHRYSV